MKFRDRLKHMWRGCANYETAIHLRNVLDEVRNELLPTFGCYAEDSATLCLTKVAVEYVQAGRVADPTRARIVQQRLELRKLNELLRSERQAFNHAFERGLKVGLETPVHLRPVITKVGKDA